MLNNPIQITTNELVVEMRNSFKEFKMITDKLAMEMRKGFNDTHTKMSNGFKGLEDKIVASIDELAEATAHGFKDVDIQFAEIRRDHGTRIRRVERKLQLA